MARVLIVETKPTSTVYRQFSFDYDKVSLTDDPTLKKVLKKDVVIETSIADGYDWVILIGSEPFKFFTGKSSVTEYSGKVVNDKFIPTINPSMLAFKPEAKPLWEDSVKSINAFVTGSKSAPKYNMDNFKGIQDETEAFKYLLWCKEQPYKYIGLDSETSDLYPRNGEVLGISISAAPNTGAYIHVDCISERVDALLREIFNTKIVVFHNAKFDMGWFAYHFKWFFPNFEDTMLLHYTLDEQPGNHGLKSLALKYTDYGDYEEPLGQFISDYCKTHGILKGDFNYGLIPFDIMWPYASIDACVTFLLYDKFRRAVERNPRLLKMYENILIPGSRFLTKIQDNGVPFDIERLKLAQKTMTKEIEAAVLTLKAYPEVQKFERDQGAEFNPNSVQQLRKLLFDYLGLEPTGILTGTGADSTNAEVLEQLAEAHPIPALILTIRKQGKIKNTYLDKIIPELDRDSKLRTSFNLHSTTSGRLSSSGKLNMQQLPRDNPAVKGCIKARPGYKIVSMDLTTAEMYIAAVLSGDPELMDVFRSGGDFHSTIAKKVFNLPCKVEDVKKLFPGERQAAKAISFGILYGAGANKISATVTKGMQESDPGAIYTKSEAQEAIDDYFKTFKRLKKWLKTSEERILADGFIYSHFGRKRRLRNINSDNKGIIAHEVRSGINFLIQSPSSDINLLAAIEMQEYIEVKKLDASIFALVHDSVLAEVKDEHIDQYCKKLKALIEMDRGLNIPGMPIGCEFSISDDYSEGGFEEKFFGEDDKIAA
jgi:DNA polymerase I-like protein with 3'-5' exonuclease and polymerase domains